MCAVTTPSSKGAATASKALPGRQPQPATLVIFGAGGDLTKRLVVPALYHLVQAGKLPDRFAIIGVDQNDQTTAQWRQNSTNMIQTLTPAGRSPPQHGHGSPIVCIICLRILRSRRPSGISSGHFKVR
jgi:hypothetical protein